MIIHAHPILYCYSTFCGLSKEAAAQSLKKYGPNVIVKADTLPFFARFLLCFVSGFAPLLWVFSENYLCLFITILKSNNFTY